MNGAAPDLFVRRMYSRRFSELDRQRKCAIWKVLVEDFFQAWIPREASVLDLGCGYGEFLNHVRCARRVGVDVNPESPSLLNSSIEFHLATISRLDFCADASFDFVFTSNVMEHLRDKQEIEQTLREVQRVLKPSGQFVAMGPNMRFLHGGYWDFWDHQVPVTDRSLVEVLELLDFEILKCIPRFLPYTTRSRIPQSPSLVKMYLRCPFLWPLLGRQFLVRARKA